MYYFLTHLLLLSILSHTILCSSVCAAPSTPQDISLDSFDSICGSSSQPPTSTQQVKVQYCQSARSAIDSAQVNNALWKVWAAVGAVCLSACLISFAGYGNIYVCPSLNAAAGVTDAVLTKQYMTAITALGASLMGVLAQRMINPEKTEISGAGEEKPAEKDISACGIAVTATMQAYTDYGNMQANNLSAQQNLWNAQNLVSQNSTISDLSSTNGSNRTPFLGTTQESQVINPLITQGTTLSSTSSSPTPSTIGIHPSCIGSQGANSAGLMVQCALANDSSIPRSILTPDFSNDLQKTTGGLGLNRFLATKKNPTQALVSTMGGLLTSAETGKIASVLESLGSKLISDPGSSTYSNSRRSGSSTNNSSEDDQAMKDFLNNIMDTLNPKKETEQQQKSKMQLFGSKNGQQGSPSEPDPTQTLFDRVSKTYQNL